ncbi:anoctamin-10 [Microdochium nivale]|nr:anoctamin-10 [Microdochium nivale]
MADHKQQQLQQPNSIARGPHNDTYVIHYDLGDAPPGDDDKDNESAAVAEFRDLCSALARAGLDFEVRPGEDHQSLLIFARAPGPLLRRTVFASRLKDWLHGTTSEPPPLFEQKQDGGGPHGADAAFEAEDLLSVYHLVSWPESSGGAGISPGHHHRHPRVRSIFPLHNAVANKRLLSRLSRRVFLARTDLDSVRDLFGAKTAFYFAFMQTYFLFLFFPAATGLYAWMFLPAYSFAYAAVTLLGCTVFIECWKIQEAELAARWSVRGVGHVKINRSGFRYDQVTIDAATGKERFHYARWKLVARQMLQVPFFLTSLATLGAIISVVFALEVLVSEVYEGAYKGYLEYLPTVILAIGMPYMSSFLEAMAVWLAEFENHRTQDDFELSAGHKMFLLSFISNYMPIFITAFVYVPLGDIIVPQLQLLVRRGLVLWGRGGAATGKDVLRLEKGGAVFRRDPDRLRNEVVALTVTGQVSDMVEEMLVPYLRHRLRAWWRGYKARRVQQAYHCGGSSSSNKLRPPVKDDDDTDAGVTKPSRITRTGTTRLSSDDTAPDEQEEEEEFLASARRQASLDTYNVQDDLSEMVIQFGHLALFSPAWPLVSVGFLVNNWVELRSDLLKICAERQRPHPTRAEGIGASWTDALDTLALLGSICTGAIVHLFGGVGVESSSWLVNLPFSEILLPSGRDVSSWCSLPVTIFISEHVFLVLRGAVRFLVGKVVGSDAVMREHAERHARRQRQWDDMVARADAAGEEKKNAVPRGAELNGSSGMAASSTDCEEEAKGRGVAVKLGRSVEERPAAEEEASEVEQRRDASCDQGVVIIREMNKIRALASRKKKD